MIDRRTKNAERFRDTERQYTTDQALMQAVRQSTEAYWGVPIELEDKALTYLLPKLETIYYAFNTIKGKRVKR